MILGVVHVTPKLHLNCFCNEDYFIMPILKTMCLMLNAMSASIYTNLEFDFTLNLIYLLIHNKLIHRFDYVK